MIGQTRLLRWYQKNRRDLPWRRTKDPYRIWVSEIMLQQTTVATVIPYYHRFLKRFPTVQSLAAASEEEALRYWSGLGYYSRARNLHKAASIICQTGRTGLTGLTAETWKRLPGIGRYTAGAIASIAFDERAPILDGNVVRVLSRLFTIRKNPKTTEGSKLFWKKAQEVLPQKNCGDFNQALMELGATVCLPENPRCDKCPLNAGCLALKGGNTESFPRGKKKRVYQKVRFSAAVVINNGAFLMRRRPEKGLLRGLWEFPMVEGEIDRLRTTLPVSPLRKLSPISHSVLNKRLSITPYLCKMPSSVTDENYQWFTPRQIGQLATSSMNRKILERMTSPSPP